MLSGSPMNAIFFGLKRAYHGTLRTARSTLACLGLTAARFDMLFALQEPRSRGLLQSELRRTLGVAAPTVSRMLDSLQRLGLISRTPVERDRRQRWIELTKAGRKCIKRASWMLISTGQAQLAVDSALDHHRWYDADHCFFLMEDLETTLRDLREAYRDIATLYYRWHPDD